MIFTVFVGYYYSTAQMQQIYQRAVDQRQSNIIQQNLENMIVWGALTQTDKLTFYINNTGPAVAIVAYWVFDGPTGATLQYENTTTLPRSLPLYVNQGQSFLYSNTNISVTNPFHQYMIKVLTSKGTVAAGTYPSQQLVTSTINSQVAGGIGSLTMTFSSFNWYSYVTGPPQYDTDNDFIQLCSNGQQCNGGTWQLDTSHPHTGSLVPQGQNSTGNGCSYCGSTVPLAFSVNITNNDPSQASLVINSEANLWVIETCDTATFTNNCPQGNPVYVFYIMNVNPSTGVITSTGKGSFQQIIIPYGVTKTMYFGAAFDLSTKSFGDMSLGSDDSLYAGNNLAYYGEFAVFLLFSGTKIPPANIQVYGQNIPFETTISADNLGWYSETPTVCTSGYPSIFDLSVNNSIFSGYPISQIQLNASAFSSVSAIAPTGWTQSVNNGWITWTNSNSNNLIQPGQNLNFAWIGSAPTVSITTQLTFPLLLQWNGGGFQALQGAAACFDTPGLPTTPIIPFGIVDFVPITLFNLQNTPVAGGTPVQINVDWASYSSYLDNPVDNVLFFDFNANPLNAWMENGSSYTSTNSVVWVKLDSAGIPATSSTTIYMGFYAKGDNVLSPTGSWGEASQLTSSYGQYDNGAQVFSYYNNGESSLNFNVVNGGGLSLTPQTNPYGTTSNVLTLSGRGSGSSDTIAMFNQPVIGDNFVMEGWVNIGPNQNALYAVRGPSSSVQNNYLIGDGWAGREATINYITSSTNNQLSSSGSRATGWFWNAATVSGTSLTDSIYNNAPELGGTSQATTSTTDSTLPGSNQYLGLATWAGSSGASYFFQFRARIMPPNNVMPTAFFGSVIGS